MNKLIVVAGVAGSGKSYIGKEISKLIENCVYLDKDTQTRLMVDSFLFALGSNDTDRESSIYLEKIRPLEYDCMMKQAMENIELGKNVVVSAPFLKEFNEQEFFENLKFDLEFEDAHLKLVWVDTDPDSSRKRIIDRNAKRDEGKIKAWSEYINKVNHEIPSIDEELFIFNNRLNPEESTSIQLEKAIEFIQKV